MILSIVWRAFYTPFYGFMQSISDYQNEFLLLLLFLLFLVHMYH